MWFLSNTSEIDPTTSGAMTSDNVKYRYMHYLCRASINKTVLASLVCYLAELAVYYCAADRCIQSR